MNQAGRNFVKSSTKYLSVLNRIYTPLTYDAFMKVKFTTHRALIKPILNLYQIVAFSSHLFSIICIVNKTKFSKEQI